MASLLGTMAAGRAHFPVLEIYYFHIKSSGYPASADPLPADETSSASSLTLLRSRGGVAATTRMASHMHGAACAAESPEGSHQCRLAWLGLGYALQLRVRV